MPIRLDWAASRPDEQGTIGPLIVYGHQVIDEVREVHRTMNIDTGCVFGGQLTALRYPEMELVQVPAAQNYYHPEKPETEEPTEEAAS